MDEFNRFNQDENESKAENAEEINNMAEPEEKKVPQEESGANPPPPPPPPPPQPPYQNYGAGWNSSSYYSPEPPKKKKNYNSLIAIIIVFVTVGMFFAVGYGVLKSSDLFESFGNALNSSNPSEENNKVTFGQYEKPEGSDNLTQNEDGSYSPADLYTIASPSIVGVLNYTNGSTTAQGQGSGVIISEDGYIVTNAHVVNGADAVSVVMGTEKEEIEAKIIGSDARTDIAVLKVEKSGLSYLKLGNSDDVKVGEMVAAIGNPGGLSLSNSLTVGYVSGLDREVVIDNYSMKFLQTDAAINPGNSGGALINMYGQLIGINSAKISDTNYEGIGFAIPINEAVPIIETLIENGYVKGRVRIGISVQEISAYQAHFNNIPEGLMIYSVDRTCDCFGKVQKGDIITEFNGEALSTTAELYSLLEKCSPDETVKLKIYRTQRFTGSYIEVEVKLSEDTGTTNFEE